jgi:4-aminobutyrate aminotransferase-like enzyme
VGHAHPRVISAVSRAMRSTGGVNMRYLHPNAVRLAEKLVASLPRQTCSSLDTVLYCNSGSEANDLAWRMAVVFTGNQGALCTENAYHGITQASVALSPETVRLSKLNSDCASSPFASSTKTKVLNRGLPLHVECFAAPNKYRGTGLTGDSFRFCLFLLRLLFSEKANILYLCNCG